jgi:hypothetical protein
MKGYRSRDKKWFGFKLVQFAANTSGKQKIRSPRATLGNFCFTLVLLITCSSPILAQI